MTDTTAEFGAEVGILKVDRLGRVRTPAERREALLEKYEKSGLSVSGKPSAG